MIFRNFRRVLLAVTVLNVNPASSALAQSTAMGVIGVKGPDHEVTPPGQEPVDSATLRRLGDEYRTRRDQEAREDAARRARERLEEAARVVEKLDEILREAARRGYSNVTVFSLPRIGTNVSDLDTHLVDPATRMILDAVRSRNGLRHNWSADSDWRSDGPDSPPIWALVVSWQ